MRIFARLGRRLRQSERGATGLETIMILVAFVTVAAVFSYSVLTAGIFASDTSKEAVTAAVNQATGTVNFLGEAKADGVLETVLTTADAAGSWTVLPNVTAATATADRKEGSASVLLTIADGFGTGLAAYENLGSTVDLSEHYAAGLWIKASTDVANSVLQLVLDDSAGCASPEETLDITPGRPANGPSGT